MDYYDEYDPLLHDEGNKQDDDYNDISFQDSTNDDENIGLENVGSPIGTGEEKVYEAGIWRYGSKRD